MKDYQKNDVLKDVKQNENVKRYYNDIKSYDLLKADEEKELLIKAKNGDKEARNKLIALNQRAIIEIANKKVNKCKKPDYYMDLIQEGSLGLIKAIDKFDIERNERFLTYAYSWVNKYIDQFIIDKTNVVKPKNVQKVNDYASKYRELFYQEYGREPNVLELQEYLEVNGIHFKHPEDLMPYTIGDFTDFEYDNDDDNCNKIHPKHKDIETLSTNEIEDSIEKDYTKAIIDKVLSILNKDEKYAVTSFYGIGCDNKTHNEIAEDLKMDIKTYNSMYNKAMRKMKKLKKEDVEALVR